MLPSTGTLDLIETINITHRILWNLRRSWMTITGARFQQSRHVLLRLNICSTRRSFEMAIQFVFKLFVCIISICIFQFHQTNSAKILFISANGAPSHMKSMYPMARALSFDGVHRVYTLQFMKSELLKTEAPKNSHIIDQYLILPKKPGVNDAVFGVPSFILWGYIPLPGLTIFLPWHEFSHVCRAILDDEKLHDEFLKFMEEERFDAIFVDNIFSPCGMVACGVARRINPQTKVISFGTTVLLPQTQEARGLPLHRSIYPSILKPTPGYFDHESFLHRLHNYADRIGHDLVEWYLDYGVPRILRKDRDQYSSASLFAKDSDLLVASMSPMLEFVKPRANDVIELDVECPERSTELPEKYRRFVEDPRSKGTIVLAMGHIVLWDEAPDAAFDSFFDAFSKLSEYRIVWQYVSKKAKPREPPSNVIMDDWVPQTGLLYHEKTKAFVSHCGGKSFRESICAGVPVVTMPMFAEQYRNAAIAHKKGIATFLDKTSLTPSIVLDAIMRILNDSSYQSNARKLNDQLSDQVVEPMKLGRFWTEFAMRHDRSTMQKYFRLGYAKLHSKMMVAVDGKDLISVGVGVILGLWMLVR